MKLNTKRDWKVEEKVKFFLKLIKFVLISLSSISDSSDWLDLPSISTAQKFLEWNAMERNGTQWNERKQNHFFHRSFESPVSSLIVWWPLLEWFHCNRQVDETDSISCLSYITHTSFTLAHIWYLSWFMQHSPFQCATRSKYCVAVYVTLHLVLVMFKTG